MRIPPPLWSLLTCVRSCAGSSGFKARGKMFEVKSTSGKLLFSADEQEVVVGAERLRVMGELPRVPRLSASEASHPGSWLHLRCPIYSYRFLFAGCCFGEIGSNVGVRKRSRLSFSEETRLFMDIKKRKVHLYHFWGLIWCWFVYDTNRENCLFYYTIPPGNTHTHLSTTLM